VLFYNALQHGMIHHDPSAHAFDEKHAAAVLPIFSAALGL
jgi:hypothetical protein